MKKIITLTEARFGLPAGTRITPPGADPLRASWGIETPTNRGYISRGTTLSQAIAHALSDAPDRAIAALTDIRRATTKEN